MLSPHFERLDYLKKITIKKKGNQYFFLPATLTVDDPRELVLLEYLTEPTLVWPLAPGTVEFGDIEPLNEAMDFLANGKEVSQWAVAASLEIVDRCREFGVEPMVRLEIELPLAREGVEIFRALREWIDKIDDGHVSIPHFLEISSGVTVNSPVYYNSVNKIVNTLQEIVDFSTVVIGPKKRGRPAKVRINWRDVFLDECKFVFKQETGKDPTSTYYRHKTEGLSATGPIARPKEWVGSFVGYASALFRLITRDEHANLQEVIKESFANRNK